MGLTLVLIFLGVFVLLIGQAVVRGLLNPYSEVPFGSLPSALGAEVERVLPGFQPRSAQIRRKGDEARARGDYLGREMRIEADFDPTGRLVDFEADVAGSRRIAERIAREAVPVPALQEIDRVLGEASASFEPVCFATGTGAGASESHFEVRGRSRDWKWEIVVSASGRLLEVEREPAR